MQESLYQTADAGDSISAVDAGVSIRCRETLCIRLSDARDSLSDACRRLSDREESCIRQSDAGEQEILYQTADAGDSASDSLMQESLYQTADAGDSLLDSRCRRLLHRMQETLYQTADAECLSDNV